MPVVALESELDFNGWRAAARRLVRDGVAPEAAAFTVGADLFAGAAEATADTAAPPLTVTRGFMELAEQVARHRDPGRWSLLYRLLWRLQGEPRLIEDFTDADVRRASALEKEVQRAAHKMKAFVRFRAVGPAEAEAFAAWFEPAQRVVEATAPFFARRFSNMRWSIFTPEVSVHWDRQQLTYGPGADRAAAPDGDVLEEAWTTYFASVFNPARVNERAMQGHMPKRYWKNLPEAAAIPGLVADAPGRARMMVEQAPSIPLRRTAGAGAVRSFQRSAPVPTETPPETLDALRTALKDCRRCGLCEHATQAVPGEGPDRAPLMLVGEQPGDHEDLAGRPFVGPAGKLLDRALAEAGVDRARTYVTNAVKHFKHEPRGKVRLHKTPDRPEIETCRWWLDQERRLVRPRVTLALGASAALAVLGRPAKVSAERGKAVPLADGATGFVAVHPAYLLRLPDPAARETAYRTFVADLAEAAAAAA